MAISNARHYDVVAEDGLCQNKQDKDFVDTSVGTWSSDDEAEKGEGNSGYVADPYQMQPAYVPTASAPLKKKKKNGAKKGMFAVVVLLVIIACVAVVAMSQPQQADDGECDYYDNPAYQQAGFIATNPNPQSPVTQVSTGHTIAGLICCMGLGGLAYMGLCYESEAEKEREASQCCTVKKCNSWMCTAWCWVMLCPCGFR